MCDPLSIAGAAMSVGSMVANNAAESRVVKARNNAMAAERTRQQALQSEADTLNAKSQGRYSNFSDGQEQKASDLAAYFREGNAGLPTSMQGDGTPTETMPTGNASNIVTQEIAKQKGKADRYGQQQANALGRMRGFGDMLSEASRGQARDAAQLGTVGSFMRGSSGVLPYELEAANSKGSGMQQFGSLLGGLGQVGISAGLSGASDGLFGVTNNAVAGKVGPQLPKYAGTDPLKGSGSLYNIFSR